ncbi:MAG: single-stranded-DNA-specific exonuclease [Candidatus Berkelbacteria bacterium Licking1014_7]|uniref:Single-stranded-DNA-specific exonuclease RecJ n=1 Tax=Candidatus Berkelbacteria bacterium Licking1014_7 TaxID=2017147 RepID=A0A554LJI0_9BACT|nr:MAG: single-stranded-DNA-specific exonuclease [Candidatus Berkelbacteria bacterium Licking1014_7]
MHWIISPKKSNNLIEQLLLNRQIKKRDWQSFLAPDFDNDLANPFLMKGIKEAVQMIKKKRSQHNKIGIFSDYDADGIPAAALLAKMFDQLKIKWEIYIPNRDEGYGLNKTGIDELIKKNCQMIVAIDLGSTNKKEINFIKKQSIQTIIIDHHLIQKTKNPDPDAFINPRQANCKYPYKDFSAGGLVFKLAQAFVKNNLLSKNFLKENIDLAGISTICDIVPLTGENRVLAKFGLERLEKTKNIGLQALYKVSGIESDRFSVYTVGFQIGPRLNAPGRVLTPDGSFNLLTTADEQKAQTLAKKINFINNQRQNEMQDGIEKAIAKIQKEELYKNKIIIISQKDLKPGIVGLLAGKISEKYYRPTIVFSDDGKIMKGSARSIKDFHIFEALNICKKHLRKFGGHAQAAGLVLEKKNLQSFYDEILRLADKKLTNDILSPSQLIDGEIKLDIVNMRFFQAVSKLEPYGMSNPRPVFVSKKVNVALVRPVGKKSEHLKLNFSYGNRVFSAIAFSVAKDFSWLKVKDRVDIAYTVDLNEFNGQKNLQLKIIDIKNA